jgi:hypothetical protein
MESQLPSGFPHILGQSRRQMKDVELVAQLLLLLEDGPRGYSTQELDEAFAARDDQWDNGPTIASQFRGIISHIRQLTQTPKGRTLARTRFRNQADFYSLFGAIANLHGKASHLPVERMRNALLKFVGLVESDKARARSKDANAYYEAARSASNDSGPRNIRIAIIRRVLRARAAAADGARKRRAK